MKISPYYKENDVNLQDFLKMAALHWINHNIHLNED